MSKDCDTFVLSGGGVKGFTFLGAIQALLDLKCMEQVKTFIGTSVGAIICYLLIIGYSPIEIVIFLYQHNSLEKLQPNFNLVGMIDGNGAISFTPIYEILEKMTLQKIGKFLTLSKLQEEYGKTLLCVSYNMTTCCTEYIGPDNYPDLPCLTALKMSSNIPLIFERFKYMDNYYIDGGISDPFPIAKGVELGTKVLGIYNNFSEKSLKDTPETGIVSYFFKLMQIPIVQTVKNNLKMASENCLIIPLDTGELKNILQFNLNSKTRLDMFSSGYSQAKEYISKI